MKTRNQGVRRKSPVAACSESLEIRRLLSTTAFAVVPAQSILSVTVVANGGGGEIQVTPQGSSSINPAENSLTTHMTGTLLASLGSGTLEFVQGSSVVAENNGSWYPGSDPDPSGGNPANATTAVPANFGGTADLGFLGTEYVAGRNIIFDFDSPPISQSGGGYPVASIMVISTQGDVYFDSPDSGAIGTEDLTDDSGSDASPSSATVQTTGQTETLTVPVSASDDEVIDNIDVTTTYTGTLVATITMPVIQSSPTYYLRLDADQQHVDVWYNSTATGTPAQQLLYSQLGSLTFTATAGAGSITVDNSAGNVVPSGGLTLTGNSSTALKLIGTGTGDAVTLNSSQFVFNSLPVNFTGMTQTTFDPVAGTDALAVNAGTLILAAPASGGGLKVRNFSSISIAAGAELQVATPATHASRALIVASSLSIAGSTGQWTGTLDLTGNDLDIQGGSLTTTVNQLTQGYNAAGGGHWNGAGLLSSAAGADTTHLTALGVIQNNQGGSAIYGNSTGQSLFDGTIPGTADVLVKFTYLGDANLDGKVDGSDYSRIDNAVKSGLTGWYNGDFNYDGHVNGSDYTLIDNAFNRQGASLASQIAAPADQVAKSNRSTSPPASVFSQLPIASQPVPDDWQPTTGSVADKILATDSNETLLNAKTSRFGNGTSWLAEAAISR